MTDRDDEGRDDDGEPEEEMLASIGGGAPSGAWIATAGQDKTVRL